MLFQGEDQRRNACASRILWHLEIRSCPACLETLSYGVKSGTSMSTPLVTGAIACALEKNPALTNTDIKTMLMNSAEDMGLPQTCKGGGNLTAESF